MRRAAKTDDNQKEIVNALKRCGASVQSLASVGRGCPDLLVGFRGHNFLIEVKDGDKVPSAQKLTKDQEVWHTNWNGSVEIVNSIEQAIAVVFGVVR